MIANSPIDLVEVPISRTVGRPKTSVVLRLNHLSSSISAKWVALVVSGISSRFVVRTGFEPVMPTVRKWWLCQFA